MWSRLFCIPLIYNVIFQITIYWIKMFIIVNIFPISLFLDLEL